MTRQDQVIFDWELINKLTPDNILKKNETQLHRSFIKMVLNSNFQDTYSALSSNPSFPKFLLLIQATIEFLLITNRKQKAAMDELKDDFSKLQAQPAQIESCPICSKKFKGYVYIDKHIQNRHPDHFPAWQFVRGAVNSFSGQTSPHKQPKFSYTSLPPIYIPKSKQKENIFEIDDQIPNIPIYDNIFNELSGSPSEQDIDQIANKAANNMTKTINEMTNNYRKQNSTPQTPSQYQRHNQGENRKSTEPVSPNPQMSKRPLSDETSIQNQPKKERSKQQQQSSSSSRSQKSKQRSSSPPTTSTKITDDRPIPIKTHRSMSKRPSTADQHNRQQSESSHNHQSTSESVNSNKRPSTADVYNKQQNESNNKRPSTSESANKQYEVSNSRPSTSESSIKQYEVNSKRPATTESSTKQFEASNRRPSTSESSNKQFEVSNSRPSTSESSNKQFEVSSRRPSTSENNKSQTISNNRPPSPEALKKMQRKQAKKASVSLNPRELQAVLETARLDDQTDKNEIDEDPFLIDNEDDTTNYVENTQLPNKPSTPKRRDNDLTNAELDELIKYSDDELIVSKSVPETPKKNGHKKKTPARFEDPFVNDENNTHEIDFNASPPHQNEDQSNANSKDTKNASPDRNIINNEQITNKTIVSKKILTKKSNAAFTDNDDSYEYEYDDIETIPQKKLPQQSNNRQQQKKEEEISKKNDNINLPPIKENRAKKPIYHNQQSTPVHVKRMGGYDISNAELEQLIFESTESED